MTELIYGPFISRAQAKEQGLKRYYTGFTCKHGHTTVRRTACASCDTCAKVVLNRYDKKRYHNDPDFKERRLSDSKIAKEKAPLRYAMHRAKWAAKQDPDQLRERNRQTLNARRAERPHLRVKESLSARVRDAVIRKRLKTLDFVGCSIQEVCRHLESQFLLGMTWDNYGLHGWHIDHIRPCASFDLTDPEQQKQCFHYTNLQPLWAADNIRKGAKWEAVAA